MSVRTEIIPFQDHRLGRNLVHDEQSRAFPMRTRGVVDKSSWHDHRVRIFDPRPNPNQPVGNCTMCSKAMQLNSHNNRRRGVVLDMNWALDGYVWETHNDNFDGAWNRDGSGDDTGSSGLWASKTAQHTGDGGAYYWIFGGADEVIQNVMDDKAISVGTLWYDDMFDGYTSYYGLPVIKPGGSIAGGHQYTIRGYAVRRKLALGRCWWGPGFRDFWIALGDLDDLLLKQEGDAHWQARV